MWRRRRPGRFARFPWRGEPGRVPWFREDGADAQGGVGVSGGQSDNSRWTVDAPVRANQARRDRWGMGSGVGWNKSLQ